ncbi:extensin-like protein [Myxococcaceae bacterium JPH2]|nr:extensin-like protein [Myxococcaceae bacterium JPH2]
MKKAFEQNVSRAKPRLRLGALTGAFDPVEPQAAMPEPEVAAVLPPPVAEAPDLSAEVRARIERNRAPRPTAAEAMEAALRAPAVPSALLTRPAEPAPAPTMPAPVAHALSALVSPPAESWEVPETPWQEPVAVAPTWEREAAPAREMAVTYASPPPSMAAEPEPAPMAFAEPAPRAFAAPAPPWAAAEALPVVSAPPAVHEVAPMMTFAPAQTAVTSRVETVARTEAPPAEVEVQQPAAPREEALDADSRRERLKARLKAVRENPRPEPLPATVAEAGQRAVERITTLQAELTRVKSLNLTLTQDLEATRRQAEKATEEARLRMDEARRLSSEMEGRVKLLADLERELAALEGERDEALLSLQESRQALQAAAKEHESLEVEVVRGKQALADSLAEEERLASELEGAKDESASLRRAVETLQGERDVLAQQVASLTSERAELLEARKALEAVHRALSQAASR